jgi:hypothetical protein
MQNKNNHRGYLTRQALFILIVDFVTIEITTPMQFIEVSSEFEGWFFQ